jgi:nitrogen regulatory protein PII-like uncharacterized protein
VSCCVIDECCVNKLSYVSRESEIYSSRYSVVKVHVLGVKVEY